MMVYAIGNLVSCIVNKEAPQARQFKYDHQLHKLKPVNPSAYIWPEFIVHQTLPNCIHPPGSVCLRHLGETLTPSQFHPMEA